MAEIARLKTGARTHTQGWVTPKPVAFLHLANDGFNGTEFQGQWRWEDASGGTLSNRA